MFRLVIRFYDDKAIYGLFTEPDFVNTQDESNRGISGMFTLETAMENDVHRSGIATGEYRFNQLSGNLELSFKGSLSLKIEILGRLTEKNEIYTLEMKNNFDRTREIDKFMYKFIPM